MNGNGDAVKRKVKEWLRHADDDLRLARVAFKLKSAVPYKLVAYHAQQGAEKSLKAYLVYKKIDFPHTHDLVVLLKHFPINTEWVQGLQEAARLRIYAITTRYPGEEKVTRTEALRAVSLAESVRKTILRELARDGFKISSRRKV